MRTEEPLIFHSDSLSMKANVYFYSARLKKAIRNKAEIFLESFDYHMHWIV